MKKTSILAALVLVACLASAKPVNVETARRAAENVLGREVVLVDFKDFPEFHLFRGADGQGFVLLSAEDGAMPLLGYSATGTFRTEGIPSHILSWLDGYRQQIDYIAEHGIVATPEVAAEWQELLSGRSSEPKATVVDTLLTANWDQSGLYNRQCPYDEAAGQHALVGCVATAVSQVMYYWGHPAQGRGYHAYKSKLYDTISVDYSQSVYRWDLMPDRLALTSSDEVVDAVAKLCFETGVMMDMNYSPTGSGAYEHSGGMLQRFSAEIGLENHYFYNPGMYTAFREGYTDDEWNDLIGSELEAHHPVIYTGSSSSGGHAFVIDGRNRRGHFHVNWGWGGYSNGYFRFGYLNIAYGTANGGSFNEMNNAIIGVYPITPNESTSVVEVVPADETQGFTIGSGTYDVGSERVLLHAIAREGYRFDHWASGSRVNPIFYYPTIDYHDTAYFVPLSADTLGYGMNMAPNWDTVYTLSHTEWGIRIPANRVPAGKELRKVQNFIYTTGQYVLRIYLGGDTPEGDPVYEDTLQLSSYGWRTIVLDEPVPLDGTQPLWITFAVDSVKYPAGICPHTGNNDGSWIKNPDGGWQIVDTNVIGYYTWVMRGIAYNPTDGIEETLDAFPAAVSVHDRLVVVETAAAQPLAVYDLQGRRLCGLNAQRLVFRAPAAGVYVVRAGTASKKVIVQ